MGTSFNIVVLLALAAASTTSVQACDDTCLCPSSFYMDCTNRGFTRLPEGYWPNTLYIIFWNNDIAVVDSDSFKGYPNLRGVDLQSNKLKEIDLGTFSSLTTLSSLSLGNNTIEAIVPPPTGTLFDQLETISLPSNKLSFLDPDFFQFAPNLKQLHVSNNPLVVKDGQPILNIPTLEILFLMLLPKLNVGPQTFLGLPNLESCILRSSGITNISHAFVTNKKLSWLSLDMNSITEVTAGDLPTEKTIKNLYLEDNPLERLDVSAVDNAMAEGGILNISDTPLACSCGYEDLYRWAEANGITLTATCKSVDNCSFTK